MTQHPATCLYCGRGNVPDDSDDDLLFLDLERDINWGDSTYLCSVCVQKIAALFDYYSSDDVKALNKEISKHKESIHDLRAELQNRNRRLAQISTGLKVLKEEKAEPPVPKRKDDPSKRKVPA